MNIHAVLHQACAALEKAVDKKEAKLEVQMLLQHILDVNHAWLITHAADEIENQAHQQFQSLIQRRISGEPIAYILGEREFYGLTFKITSDTLIPRPDTESLVEAALAKIPNDQDTAVLDLGTGTGAIALAIAKHRPQAQITAVDNSISALTVAQENAQRLNINNVRFTQSHWFKGLKNQMFDLIVSNPPYIEDHDPHLSQGDLRFEPIIALASGEDGLDDLREITANSVHHLKPHGWLLLEHGYKQAAEVAKLLKDAAFHDIQHIEDLAGIQRVTLGHR